MLHEFTFIQNVTSIVLICVHGCVFTSDYGQLSLRVNNLIGTMTITITILLEYSLL